MIKTIKSRVFSMLIPAAALMLASPVHADEPPCPFDESRSGLCGYYHSQISPSEAFVNAVVKRGKWSNPSERPVILDVRSTTEYEMGHPEGSYNVPYPYIYRQCDGLLPDGACVRTVPGTQINQDPEHFVNYVQSIIKDKDTPIYTLCRTGVRSVGASNLLTDAGYTNVRNIWEGYVGIHLTAPKDLGDGTIADVVVDLNHDGIIDDRDKNGWRYHYALPYETRLLPRLVYQSRTDLYGAN
jgi:rhodanese-related sulfurtransferase